ncbi:hypothetical protein SVAN01_02953 [Stagonosporopsis vannaccii]|nr:hypothetical protein SVAN01_02953 [Stagonosporopsis vannaccii]
MASLNEALPSKRRIGRRRLPPLEPGPALQFVIANHPDQFRAGKTMRHVRSHVMYKHRTERKTSTNGRTNANLHRSASAHASSTSSAASTILDGPTNDIDYLESPPSRPRSSTWTGGPLQYSSYAPPPTLRALIHHILSSTLGSCSQSAPPMFEDASAFPFPGSYGSYGDPLDELKLRYIESCAFHSGDKEWMRTICVDQTSFLSHVSVSSVYQDLAEGFWHDSGMTMQAKTHALRAISGQLESNNATIVSILHLLLSEVGGDESAFRVHFQGLQGLIQRRGGLSQLPAQLVTYVTLILTALATFKHLPSLVPSPVSNPAPSNTHEAFPYISPLYTPYGELSQLGNICSVATLEILGTIHSLTQTLLHSYDTHTLLQPTRHHLRLHEHLLLRPPAQNMPPQDWVHESIRLAALIQSHAVLHRVSLAAAANAPNQDTHASSSTTLVAALLHAVEHTDTGNSWGALRGVFVWVCVMGGAASRGSTTLAAPASATAASRPYSVASEGVRDSSAETWHPAPSTLWARKCFSLWAVRAVVSSGFEHAGGMVETLRCGTKVREVLEGWEGR